MAVDAHMRITYVLVRGNDVLEQRFVDLAVVSSLLKRNAVDLTGLNIGRDVVGIHLPKKSDVIA